MSFQQGLSGLGGASKALDTIGNNIANSGTAGFKGAAARFSDVFAASLSGGGGNQVGVGVGVSAVYQTFTQGNITTTGNPLDLAINGSGFMRMSENGSISYTRSGQLSLDKNGYIVNSQGRRLTGYSVDASGIVVPGSFIDLQVSSGNIPPSATGSTTGPNSGSHVQVTLDSRSSVPSVSPFSSNNAATYTASTAQTIYDSLGNPHNLTMFFEKLAVAGQYNVYTSLDNGATTPATLLQFKTDGSIDSAVTTMPIPQAFVLTNGAANLSFNLDLTGTTQYGVDFGVNLLTQDGYTSGRLTGVNVGSDGVLQGRYSNGKSQSLGQVVLANFVNPNGLQQLGANQWAETSDSGQPLPGTPGQGSLGAIQSGAVEESNVDLTAELVNMITQQRAYQANAQSIKTQDSVLQTLVNLR